MNPVLADHEIQVFTFNHRRMMSELAQRRRDTDATMGDSVAEARKASNAKGPSLLQQAFSFFGRAPRTLQSAGR
jgi:hypothetical protein